MGVSGDEAKVCETAKDQAAATERGEWRRPRWRRIDAGEADTTLVGFGSDIVFS